MKKLMIFTAVAFLSVSCMYEDCLCDPELADSDASCVITDSDSVILPDNDDSQSEADESGNNSDDQTDNNILNDEDVKQECGNGKIETGELCDKNSVQCTTLDTNFESGMAVCKASCTGWDTTNCIAKPEEVTPLATIPAKTFTVDYLYNGTTSFSEGANQSNELYSTPLFSATITMTNGTYYIPHNQANTHWLAGFYDSTTVQFVQRSYFVDDNSTSSFTTPYIVMGATIADAEAGATLSIGIKNENEVNFIVTDIVDDADCIILVGYGTLTVNSINLTAGSAGDFSFTTSAIGLYLPSQTPEGDVTSDIQSSGFTVCQ
ncbi:MAG TPA: hypothetical protein PKG52_10360 [bacterium]|nr:hypothetical protein [bacterium]HPS29373.1 hypothetical protein [bacterium]